MDETERLTLLRTNPERYATTGLDWGNPQHHDAIEYGLFRTLMGVLARQQGHFGKPYAAVLRNQQARIEQRHAVIERVLHRRGGLPGRRMEDAVVVYGLEKMADGIEEGAEAWERKEQTGRNVLSGIMLENAVAMAGAIRNSGCLDRFLIGPFGGLSKVAALITRHDVALEMEDLPALEELVQMAREIPVGNVVMKSNPSTSSFCETLSAVLAKLWKRDQEQGWTV